MTPEQEQEISKELRAVREKVQELTGQMSELTDTIKKATERQESIKSFLKELKGI